MSPEVPCLLWLSAVHAYARWHRQGIPMLAVRYDDLVADPRGMLATVLAYLRRYPIAGADRPTASMAVPLWQRRVARIANS